MAQSIFDVVVYWVKCMFDCELIISVGTYIFVFACMCVFVCAYAYVWP